MYALTPQALFAQDFQVSHPAPLHLVQAVQSLYRYCFSDSTDTEHDDEFPDPSITVPVYVFVPVISGLVELFVLPQPLLTVDTPLDAFLVPYSIFPVASVASYDTVFPVDAKTHAVVDFVYSHLGAVLSILIVTFWDAPDLLFTLSNALTYTSSDISVLYVWVTLFKLSVFALTKSLNV